MLWSQKLKSNPWTLLGKQLLIRAESHVTLVASSSRRSGHTQLFRGLLWAAALPLPTQHLAKHFNHLILLSYLNVLFKKIKNPSLTLESAVSITKQTPDKLWHLCGSLLQSSWWTGVKISPLFNPKSFPEWSSLEQLSNSCPTSLTWPSPCKTLRQTHFLLKVEYFSSRKHTKLCGFALTLSLVITHHYKGTHYPVVSQAVSQVCKVSVG